MTFIRHFPQAIPAPKFCSCPLPNFLLPTINYTLPIIKYISPSGLFIHLKILAWHVLRTCTSKKIMFFLILLGSEGDFLSLTDVFKSKLPSVIVTKKVKHIIRYGTRQNKSYVA